MRSHLKSLLEVFFMREANNFQVDINFIEAPSFSYRHLYKMYGGR